MEKGGLKGGYSNGGVVDDNQKSILDLLQRRPAVYEVCKWEIDPITKKPRKVCWIEELVNALLLR